jgi:hypothetical protein
MAETLRRRMQLRESDARLANNSLVSTRIVEALVIKAMAGDIEAIRLVFELDRETYRLQRTTDN